MRLPVPSSPVLATCLVLAGPSWLWAQDRAPWYERVRFAGDFRVRSESFFREGSTNRSRLRFRLRAGATAPLGDQFTVSFRLASGVPGNVTSANIDFGDAFTQKTFRLDRAFLTWTPHSRIQVTGGKFAMPLWSPEALLGSELIFDEEVAPEGFHQAFTLHSAERGVIREVTVLGEQWVVRESSGGSDSWMVGAQGLLALALGARTGLDLSIGYLNYLSGRQLAQARNGNDQLLVTNSVVTRSGEVLDGGSSLAPPAGDPFDRFVSAFRIIQAAAGVRQAGVLDRELAAYVEWAHNAGAAGLRDGVWAGVSLGAAPRPGDWGVGLAWARVEQEAVLSMFSYSDLGFGGTNVAGPMIQVTWRPIAAILLQAKDHIIRPLRVLPTANRNRLHRLQVDARVSF